MITVGPRISGIRLSGSSQYQDFFNGHYRVKVSLITGKNSITLEYRDFPGKIPIFEVNKCNVVNLKILISGFFEIFGHLCPDIQGLAVLTIRCCSSCGRSCCSSSGPFCSSSGCGIH